MHNPFIGDAKHRLASWKHIRDQILQAHDVDQKIHIALTWWQQAPLQNRVLDWDAAHTWPAPWDLIYHNEYCSSAHSLGIAYTLLLADPDTFVDLKLQLIWDRSVSIQKIVVATQGYCLNLGFVDKTPMNRVKDGTIQNTWEYHHKQWHTTRPK